MRADPKTPTGPKATEITPEMLKAGVAAFCAYDARFEEAEHAVRKIYRAMMATANSLADRVP